MTSWLWLGGNFVWLGALIAPLLAFQEPTIPALANFDKRLGSNPEAVRGGKAAAETHLRELLPGARVEYDPIITAPRVVAADGFLSGANGRGRGISDRTAAAVAAGDPHRAIKAFLQEHHGLFGHGAEALNTARVKREFVTAHNGLKTVIWEQQLDGISVFEGLLIAHTTRKHELVNVSSHFLAEADAAAERGRRKKPGRRDEPVISAGEAVTKASENLGEQLPLADLQSQARAEGPERKQTFKSARLKGDTEARLVWLPMNARAMRLCWEVLLGVRARSEIYRVLIDAETGEALVRHCLTSYLSDATYRVFTSDSPSPFSPGHTTLSNAQPPLVSRVLVVTNAVNTNASPIGWITDGDNETRGNNVDAHLDRDNDDLPDLPRLQGSPARVFDFPLDLNQPPYTYFGAAVVQLFYWNNWIHDKLYALGFTEAAGNFQVNNFGRGGLGNDAVQADAQDGGGSDNANMATLPDGIPARMQMYIFTGPDPDRDGDLDAEVIIHEYTHGLSNRRVGGGSGITALQTAGMGEGWSDFYALALLSEPADDLDGTYAFGGYVTYQFAGLTRNYYFGIRRYPYCTDLNRNPLTFKDIDPSQASSHAGIPRSPLGGSGASEVHNQGEVWCVTLWEARASLIRKHGFAIGNQLILQLVTDGMNLSPLNPNFLEARDAIIQADLVYTGGANYRELWAAFARRGMGVNATSPSSSTTSGVQEAFDLPDELIISPRSGFTAHGPAGGPFKSNTLALTLTNIGTKALTWTASEGAVWLNAFPAGGTLGLNASATLTASLHPSATNLPAGIYTEVVRITNQTTGVSQERTFRLLVGQPDFFTESFERADFDLANQTLTFIPDGSASFYSLCRTPATNFPSDPRGGISMPLTDDAYGRVLVGSGQQVSIYGIRTNAFYVGSNGELAFRPGGTFFESGLGAHFERVRVAALAADLNPAAGGSLSRKEFTNRMAVTWQNVPEFGTSNTNSLQIELFFDGTIRVTYLRIDAHFGVAGLSRGLGVPAAFVESDLSGYRLCTPPLLVRVPDSASEGTLLAGQGQIMLIQPASNNVTVALASSDTSEVVVPPSMTIPAGSTNGFFDITVVDDTTLDGTQIATITASAAGYTSGDALLTVFDNEKATVSVHLPGNVSEGDALASGSIVIDAVPADAIRVELSSSDTTEIEVPAFVVVPAGQTSAVFNATIKDDLEIDGVQMVTVAAHVMNWTNGQTTIAVRDNEQTNLTLTLPLALVEGLAPPPNGTIRLAGTLATNLVVGLNTTDASEIVVPTNVTVLAGQTSATFAFTVVRDHERDGTQRPTITASAPGFSSASLTVTVLDVDVPPTPLYPVPPDLSSNVPANTDLFWSPTEADLLTNGGFEAGNFSGWNQQTNGTGNFVINGGATIPPFAGSFGVMTESNISGTVALFQDVIIPIGAVGPTIFWAQLIHNNVEEFLVRHFRVEIRRTNNELLAVAFSTAFGDFEPFQWEQYGFSLAPFEGQVVRIAFVVESDNYPLNIHLDEVRLEWRTATATTFDVFFGTNPTPGPSELLGSTTNASWILPPLAPLTTYYWQVLSKRVGETSGPVWRFTTRGVDHFAWSAIAALQLTGVPFNATVTARDEQNTTVSNFVGNVSLAGRVIRPGQLLFLEDFEEGNFDGWVNGPALYIRMVTTETVASGNYSFTLIGGSLSQTDGVARAVANLTPDQVTFYVRASHADQAGGYVALLGSNSTFAARFNFDPAGRMQGNGVSLSPYEAERWYRISMIFDWPGRRVDFYVDNALVGAGVPFLDSNVTSIASIHLYNSANMQCWWDEIQLWQDGVPQPVAISPVNSGAFANGSWTGQITVLEPAADMYLAAQDAAGHTGASLPFSVSVQNDLALTVLDSPDPVAVGANLTYTIIVTNTGPAAASGITLSNVFSQNVTVVSMSASQGGCTNASGRITCGLGTLPGAAKAIVSLVVAPSTTGSLTNVVSVRRAEPEVYSNNNTAAAVTLVRAPGLLINDVAIAEGDTGTRTAIFSVRLSAPSSKAVTVFFVTTNGTARSGADFYSTNGALSFAPMTTTQNISVLIRSETVVEADEQFAIHLSSPVNAVIVDGVGTGTILNDDGLPGQVDHFFWSAIPSPQSIDQPFPITITARDAFNNTVSNFTVAVSLSGGQVGGTILESALPAESASDLLTVGYAFTPHTDITVTHVRCYSGRKVSIWTEAGALLASQSVSNIAGTWNETPLNPPLLLAGGKRYRIGLFTGGTTFYWRHDLPSGFPHGTIDQSHFWMGDAFPLSSDSKRWYLVDLRYTVGSALPVDIQPVMSGNFIQGVWNGTMTVLQASTNLILTAADSQGHYGFANPIAVDRPNDLSLAISASPDPAAVGGSLIYSLAVHNTGPAPATGVVLSNQLPASVSFVSASSSQGNVSHSNGVVMANLGTIAGNQKAMVTIEVVPAVPGLTITNAAGVSRQEVDPVPGNNSAQITTQIAPLLAIVSQPQHQSVLEGYDVLFSAAAAGTPPFRYQWQLNDANLPGATNASLHLLSVDSSIAGDYRVVVSSAFGNVTSQVATLTVNLRPPFFVFGYVRLTVPPGFSMVANPLLVENNTVEGLFPGPPEGTTILKVDGTGYTANNFLYGWSQPRMNLMPGEGFFIKNPTSTAFEQFIGFGDVIWITSRNRLPSGNFTCACIIPQTGLPATELSFPVDFDDTIFHFDNLLGAFTAHAFTEQALWYPDEPSLDIAKSFWDRKNMAGDWYRTLSGSPEVGYEMLQNRIEGTCGQVNFLTYHENPAFGRVYDVDGVTPLGSAYSGQLFAGLNASETALRAVGRPMQFLPGLGAGYINSEVVTVPGTISGQRIFLQLRAWENSRGSTYEAALTNGSKIGRSSLFAVTAGAALAGNNPGLLPPDANSFPSFQLRPSRTNTAPVLAPISDRTIHAGAPLTITNTATDADLPPDLLTFSLATAPVGAAIDPSSGLFTWAPSDLLAFTSNLVTVRVTDNGAPSLSDSKSFHITVLPRPMLGEVSITASNVTLSWSSIPGTTYRVQYKNDLNDPLWHDLPSNVTASGPTANIIDLSPLVAQRFYRVILRP